MARGERTDLRLQARFPSDHILRRVYVVTSCDSLIAHLSPDISSSYVSRLDPGHQHHHGHAHDLEASLPSHSTHSHDICRRSSSCEPHERTPLVTPQAATARRPQTLSADSTLRIFDGHHHFESRATHCTEHPVSPRVLSKLFYDTQDQNSDGVEIHRHSAESDPSSYDSTGDDSTTVAGCSQDHNEQLEPETPETPASSPRRQIVGILASILRPQRGSLLER